ncbi:MotE family protein [Jannaschia donghaensis]|uniref:Magnesium transporter MgtE intracellular domain-containing protein n=1 Tax=Jannaschia donghaensis TaxID=420998 RepID=A0A0M6YH23_9RHOB|nr:hypothetical protein [Jannaschia donghaensis]CTQ49089.1 hypothetical protein JDO7802_01099 [Jannaschia donghaensis]
MNLWPRSLRKISITLVIVVLTMSGLTRIVSASLSTRSTIEPTPASAPLSRLDGTESREVAELIRDLDRRDEAMKARELAVALREQDITLARQEIEAALRRMAAAEARLADRMQMSSTAADTDIDRLVRVYEGMKPKEAAVLFEAMEPAFASGFLARMTADAASALFSNLSPEKAYALSVLMAGRNANAATE